MVHPKVVLIQKGRVEIKNDISLYLKQKTYINGKQTFIDVSLIERI